MNENIDHETAEDMGLGHMTDEGFMWYTPISQPTERENFERKMLGKENSPLDERMGWRNELEAYTEIMKQSTRYAQVLETTYSKIHFDDIVEKPYTDHRTGTFPVAKENARRGLWVQWNGQTVAARIKRWFNNEGLAASCVVFLEAETPQGTILAISPYNG